MSFCSFNEDHLLVRFSDSFGSPTRVQFILIDLAQTKSSGKLVAVASAVASSTSMKGTSLDDLECDDYLTNECVACSTKSGAVKFVTMSEVGDLISIDDATWKVNPIGHKRYKMLRFPAVISQLSMSQFCVFEGSYGYDVWDINDTAKPVRKCKLLPGFTSLQSFAEGGFMFQMSESHKEIHVSEECSGDHVITFNVNHTGSSDDDGGGGWGGVRRRGRRGRGGGGGRPAGDGGGRRGDVDRAVRNHLFYVLQKAGAEETSAVGRRKVRVLRIIIVDLKNLNFVMLWGAFLTFPPTSAAEEAAAAVDRPGSGDDAVDVDAAAHAEEDGEDDEEDEDDELLLPLRLCLLLLLVVVLVLPLLPSESSSSPSPLGALGMVLW
ncbi:hypothetical protein Pelo_18374 [Pelomyxa schiedti]|nr:hypothetical protein Pelo_18374 [Pelomyxa schiedti]